MAKNKKDAAARKKIKRFSEIRLQIRAIKDAWRNPAVHKIATSYDDRQAERVYETVRDLMRELAKL